MEVLYGAIVDGEQLAGEYSAIPSKSRNGVSLRGVALAIASQSKPGDVACVTTNRLTGYYIRKQSGPTIVAIGDENAPWRVLLSYVKNVEEVLSRPSHERYDKVLADTKRELTANRDKVSMAQEEINNVKKIMADNIDRLLERGERVNLLVDRTGEMSQSANLFNRQATQLQRKMWFQNIKLILVACVLVIAGLCAVRLL